MHGIIKLTYWTVSFHPKKFKESGQICIIKFDMISPPITLYFKGDNIHLSIFSGILTIIAYLIIFICGVYYSLEFINKENPTAFFLNRYIDDAGHFPLNASSLFH